MLFRSQSHKFLLICYSAHLSIDVHCSTHLNKKNNFLFQHRNSLLFFSFLLFYLNLTMYSHHHSQAFIISFISQALISLISQPTPSPAPHPSPRRRQPPPSQPTPSLSVKLSSLSSPSPRRPVLPTPPIHASAQSSDQTHTISLFSLL